MSTPLVSVIMPAYNHEAYIQQAIDSVLNQTWGNFELIIIDDASSDRTWGLISACKDARVRAYRHEVNQGAHEGLNNGLSLAQGEYVAIINSDDIFHPKRLQYMLDAGVHRGEDDFFAISDISFINASGCFVPEDKRARNHWMLSRICAKQISEFWFFTGNLAATTSNFFFSRSLIDKVGAFSNLRYTHDWDWALRAAVELAPTWIRKPLLCYRVHPGNTLVEGDVWRHVHENSYVQASALWSRLKRSPLGDGSEPAARELCLALLQNESLHPLSLLCFLINYLEGVDREMILGRAHGKGGWVFPVLAREAGRPAEVFYSLPDVAEKLLGSATQMALIEERLGVIQHMEREIANRDRVIGAQATLIEERWETLQNMEREIANRDQAIGAQATLIEERWETIQHMNQEIANRDQIIASQSDLLGQYLDGMNASPPEINNQDAGADRLEEGTKEMRKTTLTRTISFLKSKLGKCSPMGKGN